MAAIEINKLRVAFPELSQPFFDLMAERVIENGFTDQRLKDAVAFLIDNFQYKKPNIADLIKFDKRIKLWSHSEVCNYTTKGEGTFDDFVKYKKNEKIFWIKVTDKEQYNIQGTF